MIHFNMGTFPTSAYRSSCLRLAFKQKGKLSLSSLYNIITCREYIDSTDD